MNTNLYFYFHWSAQYYAIKLKLLTDNWMLISLKMYVFWYKECKKFANAKLQFWIYHFYHKLFLFPASWCFFYHCIVEFNEFLIIVYLQIIVITLHCSVCGMIFEFYILKIQWMIKILVLKWIIILLLKLFRYFSSAIYFN